MRGLRGFSLLLPTQVVTVKKKLLICSKNRIKLSRKTINYYIFNNNNNRSLPALDYKTGSTGYKRT